jgi:hypothetical protein
MLRAARGIAVAEKIGLRGRKMGVSFFSATELVIGSVRPGCGLRARYGL